MKIAVVIPSFCVRAHILDVIARIGPEVSKIYVVDDACPERSGDFVQQSCSDSRVDVIRLKSNSGVGGAVMAGYRRAIDDGIDVVVKIDGDGQMQPHLLPRFVAPIVSGQADYTKGNRFYDLSNVGAMPPARIAGNAILSFMAKLSTGYWHIFDPTNGYTAIHARVAAHLPLDKISNRYFFETDMLFRLNTIRAVVVDIPMHAVYADERSDLHVAKIIPEFLYKHLRNCAKRIFYDYFLRNFSVVSLELLIGCGLLAFGTIFGAISWIDSYRAGIATPAGTVMLAALPVLSGLQFLLAFVAYDTANVPSRPIAQLLFGDVAGNSQSKEDMP